MRPLVLDGRGRLYVSYNDILYRLRFWSEDEWAALPFGGRPVVSSYDADLHFWAGLESAARLNNSGDRPGRRGAWAVSDRRLPLYGLAIFASKRHPRPVDCRLNRPDQRAGDDS